MRLFFALPVPLHVAESAISVRRDLAHVRWVAPASMHLTVRFLGEIDDEAAARVERVVAARVRVPDVALSLAGFGRFGWRVVYARVDPEAPLVALARSVEAAVRAAGLPGETRSFQPHVTLARLKPGVDHAAVRAIVGAPCVEATWRVDALCLMQSELRADGPRYTVRRRFIAG